MSEITIPSSKPLIDELVRLYGSPDAAAKRVQEVAREIDAIGQKFSKKHGSILPIIVALLSCTACQTAKYDPGDALIPALALLNEYDAFKRQEEESNEDEPPATPVVPNMPGGVA